VQLEQQAQILEQDQQEQVQQEQQVQILEQDQPVQLQQEQPAQVELPMQQPLLEPQVLRPLKKKNHLHF
jgi:hypothetical protein